MQKMIEFYYQKETAILKLGRTLPDLANICLHNLTYSEFHWTRQRLFGDYSSSQDMGGVPSMVFTLKVVADETFIRKSVVELVQFSCRPRRKPILSLFDVSNKAYWIVY